MIIKDVVQIGNPLLQEKATPVDDISAESVQKVIDDLVDSMRYHELVGMSASQIGQKLAIFVTEIRETAWRKEGFDALKIYINPKITWMSPEQVEKYEGCGSVAYAKLFGPVRRSKAVTIEGFDRQGNKFELSPKGFLARVIQHEYDHLAGIEFTERITDIRKIMSEEEYLKMVKKKS